MSPLDLRTLDSDTPRTLDGRDYPEHLRAYHRYDEHLLPLVDEFEPVTFDQLSTQLDDARLQAVLPRWLASAEWRGLVERRDPMPHGLRAYGLGPRGQQHLPHAA